MKEKEREIKDKKNNKIKFISEKEIFMSELNKSEGEKLRISDRKEKNENKSVSKIKKKHIENLESN